MFNFQLPSPWRPCYGPTELQKEKRDVLINQEKPDISHATLHHLRSCPPDLPLPRSHERTIEKKTSESMLSFLLPD